MRGGSDGTHTAGLSEPKKPARALRYAWRYAIAGSDRSSARSSPATCGARTSASSSATTSRGRPRPDRVDDVVFRRATRADLDRLHEFEPHGRGAIQRACAEDDGDYLFVAVRGDRIVATRRYSTAVPRYSTVAPVVTLGPGEIWLTDMFALPDCRHQSLNYHWPREPVGRRG